jgi:hypothetical protein
MADFEERRIALTLTLSQSQRGRDEFRRSIGYGVVKVLWRKDGLHKSSAAFVPAAFREPTPTDVDQKCEPVPFLALDRCDHATVLERALMVETDTVFGNVLSDDDQRFIARRRSIHVGGRQVNEARKRISVVATPLDQIVVRIHCGEKPPNLRANFFVRSRRALAKKIHLRHWQFHRMIPSIGIRGASSDAMLQKRIIDKLARWAFSADCRYSET